MKIIYIAGPYRASTEWAVESNIRAAALTAATVLMHGAMPFCPHNNLAHMGGVVPDDQILDGDIEVLKRCDAIFVLPGWKDSEGATRERQVAAENAIPILYNESQLAAYLTMVEDEDDEAVFPDA